MNEKIEQLIEKWQDVIDCCEPDEYETKNNATEFLEDLAWLKKSLR